MRVSTSELQRQAVNSLLKQQLELNRYQQQLSTGERFSSPAEDPIAAVTVLGYEESFKTTKQYQNNADVAQTRLNVVELTLGDMTEKLQRVRQLTLQAANDTANNNDRGIIAQEINLILGGMVELSNAKDSSGEYLFSGYQARVKPFTQDSSGTYVYNGDEGQRFLQVGATRQVAVSDSGDVVFGAIRRIQAAATATNTGSGTIEAGSVTQPNDYQPHTFTIEFTSASTFSVTNNTTSEVIVTEETFEAGMTVSFNGVEVTLDGVPDTGDTFVVSPAANDNVFNRVAALVEELENAPSEIADLEGFRNSINNAVNDIDQAMEAVLGRQTEVGGRLNTIEGQVEVNDAFGFQLEKSISDLKDLDYISAISQFNLQLVAMQAAQQSYVRIQNLSLFNYL